MTVAYVDASALTKLVLEEPDSVAMRRWYIESDHVLCSRIGIVETRRAVGKHQHDDAHLEVIIRSVEVVEFDADIARQAATIGPVSLRTLDAIHLASAVRLGAVVDAFLTYDDHLAVAARSAGLTVVRPA
jgi:predicted nucleic acid-binding protein